MSDFKITEILGQQEFTTEHGAFVGYEVRFEGEQGNGVAQHNRKAASAAPKPGEVIDAELVHKGERVTLKRIWKQDGGGGRSGGGSKSSGDFRSPEQIMRGWAHSHALTYWERKHGADPTFAFASWEAYLAIVDLFYADVVGARKAAEA